MIRVMPDTSAIVAAGNEEQDLLVTPGTKTRAFSTAVTSFPRSAAREMNETESRYRSAPRDARRPGLSLQATAAISASCSL
jgi:hypothetical protein